MAALAAAACGGENSADPGGPGDQGEPSAAALVTQGDGQSGQVGEVLIDPLVVTVEDEVGRGIGGVEVAWEIASGGGSLGASSVTTSAYGRAEVTWTLGTSPGAQTATASVAGLEPATFEATASTGPQAASARTALPAVPGEGTVVDLDAEDLDGDGDRDLVVTRTAGGEGRFYEGYHVQVLEQTSARAFADRTGDWIPDGADPVAEWFDWIRLQDLDADGDIDIVVDDASRDLLWGNDGTGGFALQ